MRYEKEYLTFKEQVDLLEERGILFKDISKEEAEKKLSNINYFKLSSYIKKWQIDIDKYENVDFLEILDLYYFDRDLRNALFHSIEKIEISFKTKLAHYIAKETEGNGATSYINLDKWVNKNSIIHKKGARAWTEADRISYTKKKESFQSNIKKDTDRGGQQFIKNYFTKYDEEYLPIWMVIEVIDFGMALKMYSFAKESIKRNIATSYGTTARDLDFYLKGLKLIRNIAAHNGVLWDIKLINTINKRVLDKYEDYLYRNKIIAVIVVLSTIIKEINSDYDFDKIKIIIVKHFEEYPGLLKDFGIKGNSTAELLENLEYILNDIF